MRETFGDLWKVPADLRVITTNGDVKSNCEAVMGKGVAQQARDRYRGLALHFGSLLTLNGNIVQQIWHDPVIFSFPTKRHWREQASLRLIHDSAEQLVAAVNRWDKTRVGLHGRDAQVVMPRPGCGAGDLRWEDVRPLLRELLDDRFIVVHLA